MKSWFDKRNLCIFAHQGQQIHSVILEKCSGVDLSPLTCEDDICDEVMPLGQFQPNLGQSILW